MRRRLAFAAGAVGVALYLAAAIYLLAVGGRYAQLLMEPPL